MLTFAPVKKVGYYEDLVAEDYYLKGDEPPGTWVGNATNTHGLKAKKCSCQNTSSSNGIPLFQKCAYCLNNSVT